MPPKAKFTRKQIIDAALDIVKTDGIDALSARTLGTKLGSSARPIFTQFENMNEVQSEVMVAANALYQSYIQKGMEDGKYPTYKASGRAYIQFAKEEKELFKLLFMRDRTGEKIEENREEIRPILNIIMENLGISEDEAFFFHLEVWLCVHGIATMIVTNYLEWDAAFIDKALYDTYQGLKNRYSERSINNE